MNLRTGMKKTVSRWADRFVFASFILVSALVSAQTILEQPDPCTNPALCGKWSAVGQCRPDSFGAHCGVQQGWAWHQGTHVILTYTGKVVAYKHSNRNVFAAPSRRRAHYWDPAQRLDKLFDYTGEYDECCHREDLFVSGGGTELRRACVDGRS